MARIGIVGAGVVGRATGSGFMEWGHDVVFCDTNEATIDSLRRSDLKAVNPEEFRRIETDYTLISVSTPTVDGRIDLSWVRSAAAALGLRLRDLPSAHVVVVRSTLPPGTTEDVVISILAEKSMLRPGIDFLYGYNPEFLRESTAREDFLSPWLTVIGAPDEVTRTRIKELYAGAVAEDTIIETDVRSAEMIKYTSNLYNATKISFANEIWQVARSLGLDGNVVLGAVTRAAEGMWNPQYGTRGGHPYGGACLPKDTAAFAAFARSRGLSMDLLNSVIAVNQRMTDFQAHHEHVSSAPPVTPVGKSLPVTLSTNHNKVTRAV